MDFYINKGADLPILKLELIKDGRNDNSDFHTLVQNSNIRFTMSDIETGVKKIGSKPALCIVNESSDTSEEEYYLSYKFSKKDTSKSGTYRGQFIINFVDDSLGYCGELIVPIREELHIHILEGSIKV